MQLAQLHPGSGHEPPTSQQGSERGAMMVQGPLAKQWPSHGGPGVAELKPGS